LGLPIVIGEGIIDIKWYIVNNTKIGVPSVSSVVVGVCIDIVGIVVEMMGIEIINIVVPRIVLRIN
jgi:hypothetical protein